MDTFLAVIVLSYNLFLGITMTKIQYKLDYQNTIDITENRKVVYTISKKHRGENKSKSNWTIPKPEEVTLFTDALKKGYEEECFAWNLLLDGEAICEVGRSSEGLELKLAKFVDANKKDQWHGYPANYQKNNQDIPPYNVLKLWMNSKLISAATMAKIRKGQPCNL